MLMVVRSSVPGRAALYDRGGQLLSPAMIGVAQPDFLDHVSVGEKIKLDDGKIGGVIRAIDEEKITVEIVQARAKGSTLRAEKGINRGRRLSNCPPCFWPRCAAPEWG